ncbi:tetratricopeptide repeat protein [Alkalihalobacillus oceani]|uniref:Tetratricopeptide repeat protein n=1 Tax=Halalkalibacter oceani TaxID=1653776 RepID=A0A9X2DN71_9BACI|nr:tetratricopeptide repeat protein [Halalkalibacter oceani]MCM3713581.1 tetratricopeptide repeat protein [Halalkalibacter oceani]
MEAMKEVWKLIEAGEIEQGLRQLAELERKADHQTKYEIAEVYHELGHIEKAKTLIEELLQLYPDEGSLYALAAELLIDLDEEDEAIEMLLEIEEDDEAFLQAQLLLADLYQMQALDEVAEQKLLTAAKKAPEEPIISYALGELYIERGDYQKSIPYLKKAVHSADPIPDANIELKLAEAYSASGQFEDALAYYQIGVKKRLDPNGLFGYGFTAFQLGDMIVAIEQLEALKTLDPDFSSVYPLLAKAYEAEGRLDEAQETLEAGFKIDEHNDQLYLHAGKLCFKRQQPDDGEQFLRQAIALNPGNIEAVQTLAAYLKHNEQFDELLELVTHIRSFGEEDTMFTWYEATALRELDQYEEAAVRYAEIEGFHQDDPDFLEEYAGFLLEDGKRPEAKAYYKKLLQLQPERSDIEELLADLESFS